MKKVVIIGAGIIGATTAYQLAKQNVSVTIIDAHINGRATSAAAGIICPWVSKRRNKAWYELAKNGAAYYPTLLNELKQDGYENTGYKQVGAIRLHEDIDQLEQLKDIAEKRREAAPEIGELHLLTNEEVKEKFPLIEENYAGLFISGAARVDGRLLRDALLEAATYYGAEFINKKASLVLNEDGKAEVHCDGILLQADEIIATNGVWMKELFSDIDIDLDIKAQKGEIIHLHLDDFMTDNSPVIMPPTNQYMLTFDHGRVVIGASYHRVEDFATNITVDGIHHILQRALHVAPQLKEADISEARVGFRPFTFNHLPVFGPLQAQPHILLANGLGASGLTTGPYIGKQLAHLVMKEATDLTIYPYNIEQIIR